MGKNNRQRRADKKRRTHRGQASGPRRPPMDAWPFDERAIIESMVMAGVGTAIHGRPDELDEVVATLAALAGDGIAVSSTVGDLITSALASAWEDGWQPTEVARQVRRRGRTGAAGLVATAMTSVRCWEAAAGAPMPTAWSAQLDELDVGSDRTVPGDWFAGATTAPGQLAERLGDALRALAVLAQLSPIEVLIPPPTRWRAATIIGHPDRGDDPVLTKVRGLLAKAESTSFTAEAEALTAKAQELMSRHAIDAAVARSADSSEETPVARRLAVDDPYADAKALLLQVVVDANSARCVWYERYAMMAVVGFAQDVEAVEVLFTSLLVQASKAMLAKGSVTDRGGRSRTRSFRQSFILAFASRIGERLELAALLAQREAAATTTGLVPVLAARDQAVDEAVTKAFPHIHRGAGPAATNDAGWHAGRVAAELATLGPQQGMLDGMVATG